MGTLKTEHEELKIMFKTLKNTRDTVIIDEHHLKKKTEAILEIKDSYNPNTNLQHKIIVKKPVRLLPPSFFQKYMGYI